MFHKEPGNIIDQLAGVLTMCFMFAALLAYICFGRMVQIRLDIDNIAKKYLYQMEQDGYLTDDNQKEMEKELKAIPEIKMTENPVTIDTSLTTTASSPADYGGIVTLDFTVQIHNPLYDHFKKPGWFHVDVNETEEYHVNISSTAKQ